MRADETEEYRGSLPTALKVEPMFKAPHKIVNTTMPHQNS